MNKPLDRERLRNLLVLVPTALLTAAAQRFYTIGTQDASDTEILALYSLRISAEVLIVPGHEYLQNSEIAEGDKLPDLETPDTGGSGGAGDDESPRPADSRASDDAGESDDPSQSERSAESDTATLFPASEDMTSYLEDECGLDASGE